MWWGVTQYIYYFGIHFLSNISFVNFPFLSYLNSLSLQQCLSDGAIGTNENFSWKTWYKISSPG